MQHGDRAEAPAKTLDGLRREADLRHQHDRLPAVAHHLFDGLDIDLGLAAARHAVDQQCAMLLRTQRGEHRIERLLLVRIEPQMFLPRYGRFGLPHGVTRAVCERMSPLRRKVAMGPNEQSAARASSRGVSG